MREAILLYTTVAMGPMLPEGEKTRGEKILRTLRSGCVAERSCGHCIKELVSYPDPSAILYRARRKGSGNIGIQFLYRGGGVTDE